SPATSLKALRWNNAYLAFLRADRLPGGSAYPCGLVGDPGGGRVAGGAPGGGRIAALRYRVALRGGRRSIHADGGVPRLPLGRCFHLFHFGSPFSGWPTQAALLLPPRFRLPSLLLRPGRGGNRRLLHGNFERAGILAWPAGQALRQSGAHTRGLRG